MELVHFFLFLELLKGGQYYFLEDTSCLACIATRTLICTTNLRDFEHLYIFSKSKTSTET